MDSLGRLVSDQDHGNVATKMRPMHGEPTILYTQDETGMYTASIPEVPGAISCGATVVEAREMVIDALRELLAFRDKEECL